MMYDSFADELEKIAKEGDWWKPALGVAGGAALGLGAFALAHKGVRRNLGAQIKSFFQTGGGLKAQEMKAAIPSAVKQEARDAAKNLLGEIVPKGVLPSELRIGISGQSGVGKSTFTKAITDLFGSAGQEMKAVDLDRVAPGVLNTNKLVRATSAATSKPGVVVEQMSLLESVNPDKFDVIIKMTKPAGQVEKQLFRRGRGAVSHAVLDQRKVQKSIDTAFKNTAGEVKVLAPGIEAKFKPPEGFEANKYLDPQVRQLGYNPSLMSRREKVHTLVNERKPILPGLLPLIKRRASTGLFASLAAGGVAGGAAVHHTTRKKDKK